MKNKTTTKIAINLVLYTLVLTLLCSFVSATTNDAVVYYSFDNDTVSVANVLDLAGEDNNGTKTGAGEPAQNGSGKLVDAVTFDGVNDLINMGALSGFLTAGSNFSIGFWLYDDVSTNADRILDCQNGNDGIIIAHVSANEGINVFSGGGWSAEAGSNVGVGKYDYVIVTYNDQGGGDRWDLYVNDTDQALNFGTAWTGTGTCILGFKAGSVLSGSMDEFSVYDRVLTAAERTALYNAGIGFNPYDQIIASQIDLLFANETAPTAYKTIFDEGEEILGYINWTLSNGTIIDNTTGTCNMTFVRGVLENRSSNTNFTICNSGCDFDTFEDEFSFHSANLTDPVVEDSVRFSACHLSSPVRDIDVKIDCGSALLNFTVDKSEFPLCTTGLGVVIVNFTGCINNLTMNASVGNGALNIGQGHNIVNFEVDREYYNHLMFGGDIIYNTTPNMFQTAHTHEYYKQGSKQVFANCSNTNASFDISISENITIVNVPPQIFLEQVTTSLGTTALVEGVEVEFANGTWEWFIAVVDDDIDFINYSFFNSSGYLLLNITANGTPETINTSSDLFVDFDGSPFNLTVFANDTFGNSTTTSITFNATDSIAPSCDFAGRYFIDMGNFTFNVTCTDENFFSLNVTCPVNNVSFNVTGLNVPEYVFNQTFFLNVTDTCSFRYCDGHTTTSLIDVWFDSLKDEKYELFRNFQKVSEIWVEGGEVEFVQLHDRLKFNIMFYDTKKAYQTVYYNTSAASTHLFSSKYLGWVADPVSETWFDLNNIVDAPVVTINKGGGLWEFRIFTNEETVEFQSIGELNCVSGSFTVVAAFEYALEPGVCPTTIAGVLTMWMVLGLALFLMSVGWIWKIREPGFFGSLLLITFSWTVVACHLFAGYVCAGIGLYFLFWFILKK